MDALALQTVVIIQAVSVYQGNITLPILRDDLFGTALRLIGELRQFGPGPGEGHYIFG